MNDLGCANVLDKVLDHRLTGEAELADTAVDAGGSQLQTKPIGQKLLDLLPRQSESQRQDGDEAGKHRADQATFGQLQVPPAPCDLRAAPSSGTRNRFVTAGATADEIAMPGSVDLQRHHGSFEIIDVMRAVLPAALRDVERKPASRAGRRVVINIAIHDHRLTSPETRRPWLFAGWL